MEARLEPVAGAVRSAKRPKTSLLWDGTTLAASDAATGHSIRLRPASLYRYRYDQPVTASGKKSKNVPVHGLAALDADGLVLLDLPGDWHPPLLEDFAARAGIPLKDSTGEPSGRVRALLAGRAPGWRRLRGLPPPFLARHRGPVALCAGVAGLALMIYLASTGLWMAWRGIAAIGRMLLDVVEAKWLAVAFSPALLVLRPVAGRVHRWRSDRGLVLGPASGPYLSVSGNKLRVHRGKETIPGIPIGLGRRREASSLLIYHYDDLTGLFVLDQHGEPLHHLPGRWAADDAHRFTTRHGLLLAVHLITHDEYLRLTRACREATP